MTSTTTSSPLPDPSLSGPRGEAGPPLAHTLASRLEQARRRLAEPMDGSPRTRRPVSLSAAQRRIWFLERLQPGSAAYNIPMAWRLLGPLAEDALSETLRTVVARHEVLRTRVVEVDGAPRPEVASEVELDISIRTVADEGELRGLATELSGRPFALDRELPIRVALIRVADSDVVALVVVVHHIAFDGWSVGVLAREVSLGYEARRREQYADLALPDRRSADLATLARQYADTVPEASSTPDADRLDYWRARLAGAPQVLPLPLDRARPARPEGRGAIHHFALGAPQATGVRALAEAEHTTPFAVLLAAFAAAAARWAGADDVLLGVPVASRERRETHQLIGCYVNTVPVRAQVDAHVTGRALVRQLHRTLIDAVDQAVPFDHLVEAVAAKRSRTVPPLVQALFVAADSPSETLHLDGVEVEELPVDPGAAKLDLSLSVDTSRSQADRSRADKGRGGMPAQLTYSTELFTPATARRLSRQFSRLVSSLLADPNQPVATLALSETEEAAVECLPAPSVVEGTVLDLIDVQIEKYPDRLAVVDDQQALTYAELDRRSRGLARRLRQLGAGPEVLVGLLTERSVAAVVGLLGTLRAGAGYLPVDPAQPAGRIASILNEARATVVVSQRGQVGLVPPGCEVVLLGESSTTTPAPAPPLERIDPGSLIYVIATSGSTGTPKCVAVEHRQLRAYVDSVIERFELTPGLTFALVSTLAADLGHTSLFPALCTGSTLRLVSSAAATDSALFADLLRRQPVDVLKIVPAHLAALLSGAAPALVLPRRLLVLGGDAAGWALVDQVRDLAPQLRVFNHYGPTEAAVGALTHELTPPPGRRADDVNHQPDQGEPGEPAAAQGDADDRGPTVPLGSPLPHAVARVLDLHLQPVPAGVVGELFLGGAGVARGYLGDPDLTSERFVPDPYTPDPGARLYRTGDRVRRLSDGTLEFLGRADAQVKVRGYRVEPGDIAAVLRQHPLVRDAVVVAQGPSDSPRLVAFVVASGGQETGGQGLDEQLRTYLTGRLPTQMVPASVLVLDQLPLTANGKVDHRALPLAPLLARPVSRPPATAVESQLVAIWGDVLGTDQVGVDDDFFAVGGHSLLATQVVARIRQRVGVDLAVSRVFELPTIRALARCVDAAIWASAAACGDTVQDIADDDEEGEL